MEPGELLQFADMPAEFCAEPFRHRVQTVAQFVAMAEVLAGHAANHRYAFDFIDAARVVEQDIAIVAQQQIGMGIEGGRDFGVVSPARWRVADNMTSTH